MTAASLRTTTIRNAFNGETFIFPARQGDPSMAQFTIQLDPGGSGGGNALVHVHPVADETFTVLTGLLEVVIAGKHETLYPGESLTVPRGRPHYFVNAGDGRTTAVVSFSPPQRQVQFFTSFATLTQDDPEWFSPKGDPHVLLIALMLHSYPDHLYLSGPPVWLQKILFRLLARLARRPKNRDSLTFNDNTVTGCQAIRPFALCLQFCDGSGGVATRRCAKGGQAPRLPIMDRAQAV
jgi:mannose-6-phosphate isomerase-like protein (cupin superfamily)